MAVTNAEGYDLLVGTRVAYPPGLSVDRWKEQATYRADWDRGGTQVGVLPMRMRQGKCGLGSEQQTVPEVALACCLTASQPGEGAGEGPAPSLTRAERGLAKADRVRRAEARRWPRGPQLNIGREAERAVMTAASIPRRRAEVPQLVEVCYDPCGISIRTASSQFCSARFIHQGSPISLLCIF